MHELGVLREIFELMGRELKKAGGKRITRLSLKVGTLSDVTPDHLRESFDAYSRGTVAEGVHLSIEPVQATAECRGCGHIFDADSIMLVCPLCASNQCTLLQGNEILVNSIEVEVD